MANYTVPAGTYTSLEDIMGNDFDNTKQYRIHVNDINLGLLQIIDDDTDTSARGAEVERFTNLTTTSTSIYLRGTAEPVNIWVEEVVSA